MNFGGAHDVSVQGIRCIQSRHSDETDSELWEKEAWVHV